MRQKLQKAVLYLVCFVWTLYPETETLAQQWKTVRAGGGGAITSIVAHPKVRNLYFMTTDVGTPYRWNDTDQAWEGLLYNLPAAYWGKSAAGNITFAPSDATGNILYATIGGAYAAGTVLKSTDRGNTWTDLNLLIDVQPNSDQKFGQRIAIDPNNSDIVLVTTRPASTTDTRFNGTFRSTDGGATWTKISSICGAFITYDESGGIINGLTNRVYIGCADGVYKSTDGGATFTLMSGSPANSWRGSIHPNGTLYLTNYKSVSKWNGSIWSTITPTEVNIYSPIAVNPNNVNQVIVGINNSGTPYSFSQYLSSDGGATWTKLTAVGDKTEVPWFPGGIGSGLKCFCWDPFDQNMVWFGDWYHPYQTTNIWSGSNVTWKARAKGEEEIVAIGNVLCPPSGDNLLLSNAADIGGWDHKSLSEPPAVGMLCADQFPYSIILGGTANMTGVAVQETNPNFIARVGRAGNAGPGYCGYSTDGGKTYIKWTCPGSATGGRIAVSATNTTMLWVPQGGSTYRSTDLGATWTAISSLPSNMIVGANAFATGPTFPIAADKVNGNKFYVYFGGKFYVSTDGGATFTATVTNLPNSYVTNPMNVETTPGIEGDIWISSNINGLYHSSNSGTSFSKLYNVQYAYCVTVGKASTATPTVPAVYVYGTVNNIPNGLFRSNDNGATWQLLASPVKTGVKPYSIAADRNVYGRLFFATLGNGLMYYQDSIDIVAPLAPATLTAIPASSTTAYLKWDAASDNCGIASYNIYRNGTYIANTAPTAYIATGLTAGTAYTFSVKAKDIAGNLSAERTTNVMIATAYTDPLNIALSKPIGSDYDMTTIANANDGVYTTGWNGASSVNHPISINLKAKYNITGAEITWPHQNWTYRYKIEVSNDSSNWVMACNKMSNDYFGTTSGPNELLTFNAKEYEYIRMTITSVGDGAYWVGCMEFKVFGQLSYPNSTKNVNNTTLDVYPNPASDYLTISNTSLNTQIQILNMNGEVVYNNRQPGISNRISVADWTSGVYIIKVSDNYGTQIKKVIKK